MLIFLILVFLITVGLGIWIIVTLVNWHYDYTEKQAETARQYEWIMKYGTEEQKQTMLLLEVKRRQEALGGLFAWWLFFG